MADIPKLQGLVQTSRHKPFAVRCKRHTIHTVRMSPQPLQKLTRLNIPDPDNVVQRTRGDEGSRGRDSDRGDTRVGVVVDHVGDGKDLTIGGVLHVPDSGGAVTGTGDDEAAVLGKVERVDFLLVTVKDLADTFA